MATSRLPLILISSEAERPGARTGRSGPCGGCPYSTAIRQVGGVPWRVPATSDPAAASEAVAQCDGVLLTGGDDVDPQLYAKDIPPDLAATVRGVDPARDRFELRLIEEAFRRGKPLLAICRGQQILNVALGGTLLLDIARQVPGALAHARHDAKDRIVHEVALTPGSQLARAVGSLRLGVNSTHHQAVATLAKPLQAVAVSKDGIIEGLELAPAARHLVPFLLAVQFHPERLWARHEAHRRLFECFVRACASGYRRVTV